jgi:hypothetical protein
MFWIAISFTDVVTISVTDSESSLPEGYDGTNLSSLGLYELSNGRLKMKKQIARSFPLPETGRNLSDSFFDFNVNCLTHRRPKELKLVTLELPGNEDSGSVIKIVLPCL